jgi:hypothetical protein
MKHSLMENLPEHLFGDIKVNRLHQLYIRLTLARQGDLRPNQEYLWRELLKEEGEDVIRLLDEMREIIPFLYREIAAGRMPQEAVSLRILLAPGRWKEVLKMARS